MDQDPRHRACYARFERLWSEVGACSHAPEIAARVRAVGAARRARRSTAHGRLHRWGAAVAVLALVAACTAWLLQSKRIPVQHYSTAIAEQRSLVLPDGTRVDPDAGSALRVAYSARERRIALDRGRAYFEIAPDARRPLTVDAGHGLVRAVGTAFEVDRRAEQATVSLTEGKVLLSPPANASTDGWEPVSMRAGRVARFDRRHPPRIEALEAATAAAWREGWLVFDDQPLAEALAEFNRYNRRPIVLGDTRLGALRLSGVFRSGDVRAFAGAVGARYGLLLDESDPDRLRLVARAAASPERAPGRR